ncbi:MAG: hypothetical protein ORN98_03385 [Alphaproteobacteria bacterium]|nr:hypothetical protein [Alphaproteobacteria bacterium]
MRNDQQNIFKFVPKMRLFMSVDQIGSTAAKFSNSILPLKDNGELDISEFPFPEWHRQVIIFHNEFDSIFRNTIWAEYFKDKKEKQPIIWKRLGDEIVYTLELKNAIDAVRAIAAMLLTIKRYRIQNNITSDTDPNNDRKRPSPLNIKATFWLAGFPLINMEIPKERTPVIESMETPEERNDDEKLDAETLAKINSLLNSRPHNPTLINQAFYTAAKYNSQEIDFVGPSIDTGFRLGRKSDKNHICLSFDLAMLLAKVFSEGADCEDVKAINTIILDRHLYPEERANIFDNIFFEGNDPLKGVYKNEYSYPIFFINSPYEMINPKPSDIFYDKCTPESVLTKCENFISNMGNNILLPYIPGCPFLKEKPEYYEAYIDQWNEILYKDYKISESTDHAKGRLGDGPDNNSPQPPKND